MQRTQIYLPEDLRQKIDQQRAQSGESMAQYLRKAAQEKVVKDQKKKSDFKRLADEVFTLARKGKIRSQSEVLKLEKKIRIERELEDKHWLKRWDEAKKG